MAEYYAVITQEGYNLTATDINLPHQFSENIPIKIIKDTENFNDYELIPFFVHSNFNYVDVVASNEAFPMEYDPDTQIATLPYEAFKKRGYLFVSLALKETSGDKTIYTGTVMFNINQSLNGSNTIPSETIWIDAITKYVDTYMNNQYKPTYDKLLKDSQDLQSDAEELHNTVTSQQQNINNTLKTTQGLQEDITEINNTTKQLQQTTTQLQNNVNATVQKATQQQEQIDDSIEVMGDYEVVQDNPTQIRFKKGDGTYGDTVNLGDNLASKSMVNAGYDTYSGNSYSGSASDYGIEIGKASGAYEQEGTPTPESPIEPKFFEPKHVYSYSKNMFDFNVLKNNYVVHGTKTYTNDSITLTATAGDCYDNTFGESGEFLIKVRPNTKYTILYKRNSSIDGRTYVFEYNINKNMITPYQSKNDSHLMSNFTFTTRENCEYIKFRFGINSKDQTCTFSDFMILEGEWTWETVGKFIPYKGNSTTPLNITLRALPNGVKDTYENGVITRRVGVYIADTIDTLKTEVASGRKYAVLEPENKKYQDGMTSFLCNKIQKTVSYTRDDCIYQNASNFVIVGTADDTLETFKERFLNTIVYYELAEPYTEQVDLPVIPSYFPYTDAWHDSEVEASELTWFINTYARNSEYTDEFLQKFFALQRTGKVYTVRFPLFSKSTSPIGEKMDHNEGLTCNPSTDTIIGQDDYQDIPLFKTYDVNAYSDDNGRIHVTAFKGDKYFKDTGKVDVFVLGMSYYEKYWEDDNYWYYSRTDMPRDGYILCAECRNTDGSESSYALYSKYVSGEIDGKPYSSKGLIPKRNMSYNVCESYYHSRGKNYGGSPMYLYKYLMTTFYLKYATLNTQSKIYGCFNYSYQYAASMAENNVKRIVLTTAQAANIVVGSYVSIGDKGSNSSVDRSNLYMHNKAEEVEVISKTTVDDSHVAINVDSPTSFNTTTTTYLSTMHWKSGFSDNVLGRDGSIGDLTSGKYPMVFQGIELAVGGYEVAGNAFMDIVSSTGKRDIYVTNDNSKITTTVAEAKSMYNKSKNSSQPTTLSAWNYITKMALDEENGMFNVIECGNSGSGSATGFCDGFYVDSAASGQREFLLLGFLWLAAFSGLSCVSAADSLSNAYWAVLARLSISGRKG